MIELIVNPTAGNGRARATGESIAALLEERGIPCQVHYTTQPRHATTLAREAAQRGAQTVIACGGDGTITETAAGLRGTRTALGIIPSGTGNDFIKSVGVPKDWKAALEFILSHPARPVNTGLVNDELFLNVCGAGFDVMTLDYVDGFKKRMRGLWPYLFALLRAIFTYHPIAMHIEIDGQAPMDGNYLLCSVGNGRYIGGGIPITPLASVEDGEFDILVVDGVPRWRIPFYLPSLMLGTLHKRKPAHRYSAKACRLTSPAMRINLDGEIRTMEDVRFVCEEDALLLHW